MGPAGRGAQLAARRRRGEGAGGVERRLAVALGHHELEEGNLAALDVRDAGHGAGGDRLRHHLGGPAGGWEGADSGCGRGVGVSGQRGVDKGRGKRGGDGSCLSGVCPLRGDSGAAEVFFHEEGGGGYLASGGQRRTGTDRGALGAAPSARAPGRCPLSGAQSVRGAPARSCGSRCTSLRPRRWRSPHHPAPPTQTPGAQNAAQNVARRSRLPPGWALKPENFDSPAGRRTRRRRCARW